MAVLPARKHWHDQRKKSEQRKVIRANDSDRSKRFIHRQSHIAEGRIVHRAVVLVSPRRVRKDALDAARNFVGRLFFSDHRCQTPGDLFATLRKVLCHVIESLRARVGCAFGPAGSLAGGLDCVANVLSIAQRRLAKQPAIGSSYFHAVA